MCDRRHVDTCVGACLPLNGRISLETGYQLYCPVRHFQNCSVMLMPYVYFFFVIRKYISNLPNGTREHHLYLLRHRDNPKRGSSNSKFKVYKFSNIYVLSLTSWGNMNKITVFLTNRKKMMQFQK